MTGDNSKCEEKRRILITGFGPFPNVAENPTQYLAEIVTAGALQTTSKYEITALTLPTHWHDAPSLLEKELHSLKPHIALHFGFSANAAGLQIETMARNEYGQEADCANETMKCGPILEDAALQLASAANIAALLLSLQRHKVPASLSNDAGLYLCNALYFHSLHLANGLKSNHISLFIHIPQLLTCGGSILPAKTDMPDLVPDKRTDIRPSQISEEDVLKGIKVIIETCLAQEKIPG